MTYKMKRGFLMQEANEEVNLETEGLHSRLGEFLKTQEEAADNQDDGAGDTGTDDSASAGDTEEKQEEQEEQEVALPEIGSKTAKSAAPEFDEAAFDAETEKEVAGLDPNKAAAWKKLKSQVKEMKLKEASASKAAPAPDVQAELDRLKTVAAEAEALRQRNKELILANDQIAVREEEEYLKGVKQPLDEMAAVIKTMAEASGMAPADLAAIIEEQDIGKQDKMLDALSTKLSSRALNRIERLADDYKAITAKEREILANASTKREMARVARQKTETEEATRKTQVFKAAVADSFKQYASLIPGFTDSSGNLTDLAVAIQAKTETVDIHSLGAEDLGYLAYAANSLPEIRRELVKLRKENAILRGSKPRKEIASGTTPIPQQASEDVAEDGEPQGFMARFKAQKFSGAGAAQ